MNRNTLLLAVSAALVACDVNESRRTVSTETVSIAPRIATARGVSLPVTDSVYIKVASTDPAKIWYEKALPWSAKFVVISGLPKGVAFTVVMEGREAQGNGKSSTWWSGTQSGTAGAAQSVAAQELTVPVSVLYSPAPWNASVTYGSLQDVRDGQVYRTVVIGGRRWMAENLNYKPAGADSGWCYDNSGANCAKYGRLYSWSQTMAGAASSAAIPSGVRGVCPEGWHVPSDGEWTALTSTVAAAAGVGATNVGTALKSTSGWEPASGNGTDAFGFRFLPAGNRGTNGVYNALLGSGTIASSTEASSTMALNRATMPHWTAIYNNTAGEPKGLGLSVRCVENFQASIPVDSGAFKQDSTTLGLWRFDEGAGTSIVNQVTGKAGSLSGGVSWVSGKFGKAIQFDGSSGFADMNFDPDERNATYEVVFTPGSQDGWVFMGWGMYNSGFAFETASFAVPELEVYPNSVAWTQGKQVFMALTIDSSGNRASVYLNGRLFGTGLGQGHALSWSRLVLGKNAGGSGGFFDGSIDEFRVSKGVRSATEIAAVANEIGLTEKLAPGWTKFTSSRGQRLLPGGRFSMGSESGQADEAPAHDVTLTSFWMDTTEVTQSEFQALMGRNPSSFVGGMLPVERVSWYDAVLFCNARSKRDGLDTVYSYSSVGRNAAGAAVSLEGLMIDLRKSGYHMPTEAQWEYAAKGGIGAQFHWGRDSAQVEGFAWYLGNAGSSSHPVAAKKPNGYGLYDMSGNVWEWVGDAQGRYSSGAQTDPFAEFTSATAGSRGGCFNNSASEIRSASRHYVPREKSSNDNGLGFRCARGGGGGVYKGVGDPNVAPVVGAPTGNVGMEGVAILTGYQNSCTVWPKNAPFTIEFWVRERGVEANAGFSSYQEMGETRGLGYSKKLTGDVRFRRLQGTGWWALHPDLNLLRAGEGDTLRNSEWGHAAFVYTGAEGILYLNGTERARVADASSMACGSSVSLMLNGDSAEIDNIRVSKVARYANSFTPPTSYANDVSTVYQWTFDGPVADRLKDEIHGVLLAPQAGRGVSWVAR